MDTGTSLLVMPEGAYNRVISDLGISSDDEVRQEVLGTHRTQDPP